MKKLNFCLPTALSLVVNVLLIAQLTVSLYRTFKPKTKETDPSHDNE